MPIWLRNYTFTLLEEHYSEKTKPEAPGKSNNTEIILPDYITKAPIN